MNRKWDSKWDKASDSLSVLPWASSLSINFVVSKQYDFQTCNDYAFSSESNDCNQLDGPSFHCCQGSIKKLLSSCHKWCMWSYYASQIISRVLFAPAFWVIRSSLSTGVNRVKCAPKMHIQTTFRVLWATYGHIEGLPTQLTSSV